MIYVVFNDALNISHTYHLMIRAYILATERRPGVCSFLFLPRGIVFPDSAHCCLFPSTAFQVYTLGTCICSDNRVKTISSDKPFVWMTQAEGSLGGGGYRVILQWGSYGCCLTRYHCGRMQRTEDWIYYIKTKWFLLSINFEILGQMDGN